MRRKERKEFPSFSPYSLFSFLFFDLITSLPVFFFFFSLTFFVCWFYLDIRHIQFMDVACCCWLLVVNVGHGSLRLFWHSIVTWSLFVLLSLYPSAPKLFLLSFEISDCVMYEKDKRRVNNTLSHITLSTTHIHTHIHTYTHTHIHINERERERY